MLFLSCGYKRFLSKSIHFFFYPSLDSIHRGALRIVHKHCKSHKCCIVVVDAILWKLSELHYDITKELLRYDITKELQQSTIYSSTLSSRWGCDGPPGVSSPLSTAGPMHIAMELRWLPCANWLREGRCEQMTYP